MCTNSSETVSLCWSFVLWILVVLTFLEKAPEYEYLD